MIKIVLVYGLPILLAIYALIDCIQTDESEIRGLPKFGWIILIVLVGIVGPVAWLVAGRSRTGGPRVPLPGSRNRTPDPPRTLAPDDDPEFLGRLGSHNAYDRQLEEWEEELRKRTGDDPTDPAPDGDDPDDGPDSNRPVR
jgi:hypothetical protein